jgi:GT2 family glycosyltransferase
MKKISVIIVNYKNHVETINCINSINTCTHNDQVEIIVVNNESTTQSLADLTQIKNESRVPVKIIPSEKNLYYWGGAALGISQYLFTDPDSPKWIIIANNDILFQQTDFFSILLSMDAGEYEVVAPKITLKQTGENQNPYLIHPHSIAQKIYYKLYYFHPVTAKVVHGLGRFIRKNIVAEKDQYISAKEMKIYAPHGACIIFSKEYFLQGGYIDNGFTFYGEEISVAEISREIGLSITYIPVLEVLHNEHSSTRYSNWLTSYNRSKKTYRYLRKKYALKT